MASTFTRKNPKVVGHIASLPIPMIGGKEGTTQSWLAGQVVLQSSGVLVVGTDNAETELIVGFACNNASGTTGAACSIIPAVPGLLFEANLGRDAAYTMLAADMFCTYSLGVTSAIHYLDEDIRTADTAAGSQVFATVIDFAYDWVSGVWTKAAIGDTDARVLAVVAASTFATGTTSVAV